jgi:hypothetical protein
LDYEGYLVEIDSIEVTRSMSLDSAILQSSYKRLSSMWNSATNISSRSSDSNISSITANSTSTANKESNLQANGDIVLIEKRESSSQTEGLPLQVEITDIEMMEDDNGPLTQDSTDYSCSTVYPDTVNTATTGMFTIL